MTEGFLVAEGVRKRFGEAVALDGASLDLRQGESLALLGPSGCGKTTLLRVIAGLEEPDSGTVSIDGEVLTSPVRQLPAERRRVGMVFQDAALFPHMTVRRNVAYGLSRSEVAAGRVDQALEMVDLAHLGERRPHELSGGQVQRVALARALAPRPRVLLFDEPFTGLDTALRLRVRTEIAALLRQVRVTSVVVTHDQEEAFVLGDRVAVMRDGRVRQEGTPAEVYARPADEWVARFVGEANVVPGVRAGGFARTALGDVPVAAPAPDAADVRVLLRPEHLVLAGPDEPPGPTAGVPGTTAGVVTEVAFYGHDCSYTVATPERELLVRAAAAPTFGPGDRVTVRFAGPPATAYPGDASGSPAVAAPTAA